MSAAVLYDPQEERAALYDPEAGVPLPVAIFAPDGEHGLPAWEVALGFLRYVEELGFDARELDPKTLARLRALCPTVPDVS